MMEDKVIIGVLGCPGSGKTTYSLHLVNAIPDSIHIDTHGSLGKLKENLHKGVKERVLVVEYPYIDAKDFFDIVLYIDTSPEVIITRATIAREELAEAIREYSERQKMSADIIIPNNGDFNQIACVLVIDYVRNYNLSS